jgi:transposase
MADFVEKTRLLKPNGIADSIDPELRMLLVGSCYGIRSERRLSEEVHLNLAYRWFCRLGLDGDVPDHLTFSKIRRRVLQQYRHKTDTSGWSDDVRSLGKSRGRSIARRSAF